MDTSTLLLTIPAVLGAAILLLFLVFKIRNIPIPKESKSNFKIILIILFGTGVYAYLFSDNDIVFTCQKDTMECQYYHNTMFNRNLRLAGSYPISPDARASVKIKRNYWRRGYSRSYYKIIVKAERENFAFPTEIFTFPEEFPQEHKAELYAQRFNTFISSDLPSFQFAERHSERENADTTAAYVWIIFNMLALLWLFVMVSDLLEHRKTNRQK